MIHPLVRAAGRRLAQQLVVRRRLPADFGRRPLYVTGAARLRHLLPGAAALDPGLVDLVRRYVRPGDVVWDVGANVGLFALAAAHRVGPTGQVVAFEPDLDMVRLVERSMRLAPNRALRLAVCPVAVSDRCGTATLLIGSGGRAANHLEGASGRGTLGDVRQRRLVPTLPLDGLLDHSRPAFVKVDVEGAEMLVFQGASRLLREVRPVLYAEVGWGQSDVVTTLLRAAGYALFDAASPVLTPVERCTEDTFACPAERVAEVVGRAAGEA